MKYIEPLVSEVRALFGAPFKRSEEYKLLAAALDNIAQSDKPWMMERIVSSFPATMSRYERRKLKKIAESHGKVIEAQLYRQALCRFSLGEDVDMEKEAYNARSLGKNAHERSMIEAETQKKLAAIGAQQHHNNAASQYHAQQKMFGQISQEAWEQAQRGY